jgi:tyrosine-protein kinase Etk/Wzc
MTDTEVAGANDSIVREVLKRLNGADRQGAPEEYSDIPYSGGIDLQQLFSALLHRWRFLLAITIGGGVATALVAIALPNTYTATALILPPVKPQSLSTALMGQFGGMAGALAPSLGLKDPNELYIGILRSRTSNDALVSKFGLQQVYSSKTKEDARRTLLDRANFTSGKDSMLRLSVEDRSPQRAAVLVNAFITELTSQNNRLAVTESSQRRLFYEREVETEKNILAAAERALQETEKRTGVVEVSNQAQVVIASIARLRAEIVVQEVSLQRLQLGATADNPEVARQQMALSALRAQLAKLERGHSPLESGDPLIPVADVPELGLEYLRALREVKYRDSLLEVLAKQYEAARIDEAKEAPVIQVVDPAVPPERKSGPHRALLSLLGAMVSAFAAIIFVYFARSKPALTPR